MTSAILRIDGPAADAGRLSWIPRNRLLRQWRAGDVQRRGRVSAEPGFNVLIAEGENVAELLAEAERNLSSIAEDLEQLIRSGASGELDIGLMLNVRNGSSLSLALSPSLLELLGRCGIKLVVSVYPSAD
jgi:hypothetical protein